MKTQHEMNIKNELMNNNSITKTSLEILVLIMTFNIKIMASVEGVLNVVDIPEESIEQHKKREELKSVIDKGKLGHKWTHKRVDKASDEIINKTYAEYQQRELNEKGEKNGKALGKHVINLYSTGISRWQRC